MIGNATELAAYVVHREVGHVPATVPLETGTFPDYGDGTRAQRLGDEATAIAALAWEGHE